MNNDSRPQTPRAVALMSEVDIEHGGRVKIVQTNAERVFGLVSIQSGLRTSMKLPCAEVPADGPGPGWRWSLYSLCP